MKVSIPIKKTVTETVELPQLPYYSNSYGTLFYMITEDQNIVHVAPRQIMYWGPNDMFYADNLVEAYRGEECTKEEFDNEVAATMERINAVLNPAKGAVTNIMITDPNLQQASEQEAAGQAAQADVANEQAVAATESAAQEQAMESETE